MSPENCSYKNVKKHLPETDNFVIRLLDNYNDSFENMIKARHLNTHRALYKDSRADEIGLFLKISREAQRLGIKFPEDRNSRIEKVLLPYQLKALRKDKLKMIRDCYKVAENYIEYFMLTALSEWQKRWMIRK
ncbi:hypothetical protein H4K34_12540 [Croceimicrobium hydrocarbonivorans]|uniref:Cthe-2314-like HEPN domain-containing protein n=1 Tax=Croceimicrobium hydrocarbonivorans TaxID=2761580 RepID=A0A7H0VBV1_9FLAO|nr:hypothetical protein H4K34_12540 [Croceimicrobium hydrocarbonivorans]